MKDETEKTIREMLSEVKDGMNYNEMAIDREFGESGFDSLDIAQLLLSVQEHYDLNISDEDAEQLDTIGKLVNYIAKEKAA